MEESQANHVSSTPTGHMATDVSAAIERTLKRRSASEHTALRRIENVSKRIGSRVWIELKQHSLLGMTLAGAAGVAAAAAVGVGELAIGATFVYAAYNLLVAGERPKKVVEELAEEVAHG